MCLSVTRTTSNTSHIPITRMRIADKGRGRGTTTSKTELETAIRALESNLQRSCGTTSGVVCVIVYLENKYKITYFF